MKKALYFVVLCSLFTSVNLFAATEGQSYFGASYHMGKYEEDGVPTVEPTGLTIRGGAYVSDQVSVEGRYTFGLDSDDGTVFIPGFGNVDFEFEIESVISIFLKGDLPLSKAANVYGLVGFTKAEYKLSAFGGSATDDDSGLSYGIGAEMALNNDIFINGEYVMYIDESEYEYSGINLGFTKLF